MRTKYDIECFYVLSSQLELSRICHSIFKTSAACVSLILYILIVFEVHLYVPIFNLYVYVMCVLYDAGYDISS